MPAKKVTMTTKPNTITPTPDDWVSTRGEVDSSTLTAPTQIKMKRLTIDVPEQLHTEIKTACARRGKVMADEIRAILEKEFRVNQ